MIIESNTTNFRQSLGKMGETIAEDFLVSSAWTIEARNYYAHRLGEIDIIGKPPGGQVLAFVEVKTRHLAFLTGGLDHPGQQSVHAAKQRRIRQAALTYMSEFGAPAAVLRFDLILVDIKLNYTDLNEVLFLQDKNALRAHCELSHIADIMGTF
jgi:Holliday junction resolvase-like predicted endonuclease